MGRWALWAAHRYVQAGAAAPRTIGPDGRELLRPWRVRTPEVVAAARRVRANRVQPLWPRLLGIACLGIAFIYALQPVPPMAPHVPLSAAVVTEPESPRPAMAISDLAFDPEARLLTWSAAVVPAPYAVVLLGPDYREMGRSEGVVEASWMVGGSLGGQLVPGETYHAMVLGGQEYDTRKSSLIGFVWQ